MNRITFPSVPSGNNHDAVVAAIDLLADLGAEVVARCPAFCAICGPVLDAAA